MKLTDGAAFRREARLTEARASKDGNPTEARHVWGEKQLLARCITDHISGLPRPLSGVII